MSAFARTDTSVLGRWWWTVDRWAMAAIALLIGVGMVLTLAASPPVADRLGYDSFHFVRRQFAYLPIAVVVMFAVSLLSPRGIRRVALIGFAVALAGVAATFFIGPEIKGARRWIDIGPLSIQPSEFIKPTFAVVGAWLFSIRGEGARLAGRNICIALYGLVVSLLLLQPDVGMTVVVSAVWFTQFFLAGLSLICPASRSLRRWPPLRKLRRERRFIWAPWNAAMGKYLPYVTRRGLGLAWNCSGDTSQAVS